MEQINMSQNQATARVVGIIKKLPKTYGGSILTTDMRMWGFQVCQTEGVLTSFRIETAKDFGRSRYIDMTAIGPGTSGCTRFALKDPINEYVKSVRAYYSEVVFGIAIEKGDQAT